MAEQCSHRSDRLYRATVVSIVKEVDAIREISWVRQPADPEARLTAMPISTEALAEALGPEFELGMPLNCDKCLTPCSGIEDPFDELALDGEGEASHPADSYP
jgi:hypothetical protein